MNESRRYTVDDEEAVCMKCDNCLGDENECAKSCGPEHSWNRYQRTEVDWKKGIMNRFLKLS